MINDHEICPYWDDRSCVELTGSLLRDHLPLNAYYPLVGYVGLMELRRASWLDAQPFAVYVHGQSALPLLQIVHGFYSADMDAAMPLCALPDARLQKELMRSSTLLTYDAGCLSDDPSLRPEIACKLEAISRSMDGLTRSGVIVAGQSSLQISEKGANGYYPIDVGSHVTFSAALWGAIADGVMIRARAALVRLLRQFPDVVADLNVLHAKTQAFLHEIVPGCHRRRVQQASSLLIGWELAELLRCRLLSVPCDSQKLYVAAFAIVRNLGISDACMEVLTHD